MGKKTFLPQLEKAAKEKWSVPENGTPLAGDVASVEESGQILRFRVIPSYLARTISASRNERNAGQNDYSNIR
jgi:hypothetical protein